MKSAAVKLAFFDSASTSKICSNNTHSGSASVKMAKAVVSVPQSVQQIRKNHLTIRTNRIIHLRRSYTV